MSLRLRLSLIVTTLFITGLLAGSGLQLASAKQRVSQEVDSAADLTAQLLEVLLMNLAHEQAPFAGSELVQTVSQLVGRDLDLSILSAHQIPSQRTLPVDADVPEWFVWLVQPDVLQYVFDVPGAGGQQILLETNPSAEIREVWDESLNFIRVLLLVLLVMNGLLYFMIGHWFAPVAKIVTSLENAGQGQYNVELPEVSLPELQLITARLNQLTKSLNASQAENDRLRQKALKIQEDEQRHLARELHDELGQSIAAIKAIAFSISENSRNSDPVSWQGARSISSISAEVSDRLKRLMSRLRPVVLDELGLVPALQAMVDEWNGIHHDQFCSLHCQGSFTALDASVQIHVYRVVQEALTNVARHSKADTVKIRLEQKGADYTLAIEDNGKGFDVGVTPRGMGLTGLKERAQALGAQYDIHSGPGKGVKLDLRFTREISHASN